MGDLGVFDDVGPVLEDPVAALALGGKGLFEALVDVVEGELAAGEGVDEATVIGRSGGEDGLELGLALVQLAGRSRGADR